MIFFYNFLFNIFPVITAGLADKPFNESVLKQFPALYLGGRIEKINIY